MKIQLSLFQRRRLNVSENGDYLLEMAKIAGIIGDTILIHMKQRNYFIMLYSFLLITILGSFPIVAKHGISKQCYNKD